jgi:hypothetical protein
MSRPIKEHCPLCGHVWWQDWEEPSDCPACDGEADPDAEPDCEYPEERDDDRGREVEWGWIK